MNLTRCCSAWWWETCTDPDCICNDSVRKDNIRRMIKKFGNQVATSPNGVRWFVVDGDLWCDKSPSQIQLCGRWPDDLPFTASRLDGRPGYCEYCRGTNKAVGPDGTPYCVDCAKRFNKSVSERS